MVEYLQHKVGINKLPDVVAVLSSLHSEDTSFRPATAPAKPPTARKVTVSVEGNISVGKSTFLRMLSGSRRDFEPQVVPEPVAKWQGVQGKGPLKVNLLQEFYEKPKEMAFIFQNYVFLTRAMQERDSYAQPGKVRVLERSVFSDRLIFVRAMGTKVGSREPNFTELEMAVYESWFTPLVEALPTLVPDGFIYLRAAPETCQQRMKCRARHEESAVQLDYLTVLHHNHEDWLGAGNVGVEYDEPHGPSAQEWGRGDRAQALYSVAVTSSNGASSSSNGSSNSHDDGGRQPDEHDLSNLSAVSSSNDNITSSSNTSSVVLPRGIKIPDDLRPHLRFLDSTRHPDMPMCLHQLPVLIVDCNQHIDEDNNTHHKEQIAQQVELYSQFVSDLHGAVPPAPPPRGASGLWERAPGNAAVTYLPGLHTSNASW